MGDKPRVHFMGIGGSGMAPIAIIAKRSGFEVSGCDASDHSYYGEALAENRIPVFKGHDASHLQNADILAVTPAVFDINPDHPEILEGRRRNMLITWQQFAGQYLHKDKYLLAVAGTHGKSTTTVLLGLTLEAAGLDPMVEAGTTYRPWGGGFRISESPQSPYFVCEADEFNGNFLHFAPSLIIINNIEMDHPEYFRDFGEVLHAFEVFIKGLREPRILIVNEESRGIRELLGQTGDWLRRQGVRVIGYSLDDPFDYPFAVRYRGQLKSMGPQGSAFTVSGGSRSRDFELGVPGLFNVANSLGVLAAALELGIGEESIRKAFREFRGIGRRLELIGEGRGIRVYDDYAHHPTEIRAVLNALPQSYPGSAVWAVWEPHQLSRVRLFMDDFAAALTLADRAVITKPFLGREIHKHIEPPDMTRIANAVGKEKAVYLEGFEDIASYVAAYGKPGDIVVVFGAGNSYQLARLILKKLK